MTHGDDVARQEQSAPTCRSVYEEYMERNTRYYLNDAPLATGALTELLGGETMCGLAGLGTNRGGLRVTLQFPRRLLASHLRHEIKGALDMMIELAIKEEAEAGWTEGMDLFDEPKLKEDECSKD